MRTLEFVVKGQKMIKKADCDFTNIIAGSKGYLRAKFYFESDEWKDSKKVAGFWSGGQEFAAFLDDDSCLIPEEALTRYYFLVQVTGIKGYQRIKTSTIEVSQEVT
jgi:hypothetical protein|nr:MAG TPA: hypothetical protein [Caudoviricetes sp.]